MAQAIAETTRVAAPPAPPTARPWLAVYSLAQREWVRFIRQRNRVFGAIGQPIIFWLLFGLGLGPTFRMAGDPAGQLSYREYFFPGSLILILLFTAIFATISIIEDRREGFLQSVLVAPIPRWSMVLGKVLGGSLIALVEGMLFLALGLTLGISFTVFSSLAIVLLLALIALALTSLGFVLAWRMDSTQGFHAVMSVFLMPMWLLSGAFFPPPPLDGTSWAQSALSLVMQANPLTYGVAALRQLLYAGASETPLPAGLPALATCWIVTALFAAIMFALAVKIAGAAHDGRFVMKGSAVQFWLILACVLAGIYGSFVAVRKVRQHEDTEHAKVAHGESQAGTSAALSREPLEEFTLTDESGKPFNSKSLDGKVWVGSFFFVNCPGSCWKLNRALADIQQETPNSDVRYISITCDPANDPPEALAKYAEHFHANPARWTFLTGDWNIIHKIGKFFQVSVEPGTHSDRAFVVDRRGVVRGRFRLTDPDQIEMLKKLIAVVEAEQPATGAPSASAEAPAEKPAVAPSDEQSTAPAVQPPAVQTPTAPDK